MVLLDIGYEPEALLLFVAGTGKLKGLAIMPDKQGEEYGEVSTASYSSYLLTDSSIIWIIRFFNSLSDPVWQVMKAPWLEYLILVMKKSESTLSL